MKRQRPPSVVLKLGGELLEQPEDLRRVATGVATLARRVRLVVVHGGGKEIDAALTSAGIEKVQVDGLRVTDVPTLNVVVAVLAGAINTRLVAAVRKAGAAAVGLSGVAADVVSVKRAAPLSSAAGRKVSLGLVGAPIPNGGPQLLTTLVSERYVPIVACLGATRDGQVLNVNADTLAAHLAASLGAVRLILAGGTSGVLDGNGHTIARLTSSEAVRLIRRGTAHAGMVAKLQACRAALRAGVADVLIVNGRVTDFGTLALARRPRGASATQVVA
jgi:acetylglutamate kinase